MAKGVKRRRRGVMRGSRGCNEYEVVESELSITMPVEINSNEERVTMAAVEGKLVMAIARTGGTRVVLRLSDIELHTALHALGFVRLNDRCGQG